MPWAYICSKGFFAGLIFWGAYSRRGRCYWKEFCISKWFGLDNKNSLKYYKNTLKQLALTVHGLIFERAYYRKDIPVSEILGGGGGGGGGISGRAFFLGGGTYYRYFTGS